jgi:hypothetical protein
VASPKTPRRRPSESKTGESKMAKEGEDLKNHSAVVSRLLAAYFPGVPAAKRLTPEEAQIVARRMVENAKGAQEIDQAMRKRKLIGMASRAVAYSPFSKARGGCKLVAVVPYSAIDPDSRLVGGVGFSEGEPASGVIVELREAIVANLTTIDFIGEQVVEREIPVHELVAEGPRKFVDDKYRRGNLERDLTVDTSASIAGDAFSVLLFDEHSAMIHSPSDMRTMAFNAPLVSAIAELQYMRLEGITFSPDTSCCSCCCCCWGSCSSCSATATRYANQFYDWQTRR